MSKKPFSLALLLVAVVPALIATPADAAGRPAKGKTKAAASAPAPAPKVAAASKRTTRVKAAEPKATEPAPSAPTAPSGRVNVTLDCAKVDSAKPGCSMTGAPIGSGPSFVVGSVGAEMGHGFIEGTNLFVVSVNGVENAYDSCKHYCSIAAVYKVDLTTGNRTIVSGYYQDARSGVKVTGAGPYWNRASTVVRGTDGALYVYTASTDHLQPHFVYRVADNGDRREVWSSGTKPCAGAAGTFDASGSAVAGPHNSLLFVGDIGNASAAAAKLDLTTGNCSVFSAVGTSLGAGPSATVLRGPSVAGNKLYAVASNDLVMQIDIGSGARAIVSKGSGGGMIGAGPKPGIYDTLPGASGGVWTLGNQSRKPVTVDLVSGDRKEIDASGPSLNAQLIPFGELANKVLIGGDGASLYAVDVATGKSMVISR